MAVIANSNIFAVQLSEATRSQRFMQSIWQLRQFLGSVSHTIKAHHGLEIPELMLLRKIAETDQSPSELADTLGIPASAVSRKLELLEGSGFIVRALDKQDARRRVVDLTEAGSDVLVRATGTLERELEAALGRFDESELAAFFTVVERLGERVREGA